MKTFNTTDLKRKAWIEVSEGWHIRLKNIPETWSLGYALHRYFHSISPNPWPLEYNFMRLDCIQCDQSTIYPEAFDVRDTYSNEGQIACPHCGNPWLTFEYARPRVYDVEGIEKEPHEDTQHQDSLHWSIYCPRNYTLG